MDRPHLIHPNRRTILTGLAAAALAPRPATAQSTGADTIRLIVGFAPGSGNDLIARELAPFMSQTLKKTVIVENKPGAGGMLGTDFVAKARPDGMVIGLGTSSQLVMNPAMYKSIPFDVDRDLRLVGLIVRTPMILLGRQAGPADLQSLIRRARENPGQVTYGSAGAGSISHIVAEALARAVNVRLTHIPYKGNSAAITDLLGGHVDMVFDGLRNAIPLTQQGKVRPLAYGGSARSTGLPQVPTFREDGVNDYDCYSWNCLMAPAQTPDTLIQAMNQALNQAMLEEPIKKRLAHDEVETLAPSTPQEADAFGRRERSRWVPFVRSLGLQLG